MNEYEEYVMQMISFGGEGKSLVIKALKSIEKFNLEDSEQKLKEARIAIDKGREAHARLLTYEANHQEDFKVSMLLLHGSDYVSNAEDMYELVTHLINILKKQERR